MFIVMNRDEFVASVTNIETALARSREVGAGARVERTEDGALIASRMRPNLFRPVSKRFGVALYEGGVEI